MNGYIYEMTYRQKGYDKLYKQRHSHDNCFEIIQTLSDGGFMMIQDKLFPIAKGGLYFINALELHCSAPKQPEDYLRSKIILSSEYVKQIMTLSGEAALLEELFLKRGGLHFAPDELTASEIDRLFYQVSKSLERNTMPGISVLSAILRLFLLADAEKEEPDREESGRIGEVLFYINAHICEAIALDDICVNVHISKHHLCHLFKETTNMTVMKYILSRRLTIAKKKLRHGSQSISEVAMSSGFCSFSYFCNVFQLNEGVTPGEYRKANANSSSFFLK